MKKLDSKQHKETPEEELKRLRKRVKQLEGKEVKNINSSKLLHPPDIRVASAALFLLISGRIRMHT